MAPSRKNVNQRSVVGKRKNKQKQDKPDSDLEIIEEELACGSDVDSTTDKVHIEQKLHVETVVPSSEDYLDLDLNNNTVKEKPQNIKKATKENRKVVIKKKQVENPQPLNL